jgi:hypothetical protein
MSNIDEIEQEIRFKEGIERLLIEKSPEEMIKQIEEIETTMKMKEYNSEECPIGSIWFHKGRKEFVKVEKFSWQKTKEIGWHQVVIYSPLIPNFHSPEYIREINYFMNNFKRQNELTINGIKFDNI